MGLARGGDSFGGRVRNSGLGGTMTARPRISFGGYTIQKKEKNKEKGGDRQIKTADEEDEGRLQSL